MLIFTDKRLAFLAVPKTGTTAVEMALRRKADIVFSKRRKHITATRFRNKIAPFLKDTFDLRVETVAVMRDPVDQIRSWYKYRKSERQKGKENSTDGMDFDAFVEAVIEKNPPPFADIGSQHGFLCNKRGQLLVHHLFAYEQQDAFLEFLSGRLGSGIELEQKNVSPDAEAVLSTSVLDRLRDARAAEFELYDKLLAREGYLEGEAT